MTPHISYNVLNGQFVKGWNDGISVILQRKAVGEILRCNQCEKVHLCGYCPGLFALENGREDIRSGYICSLAISVFNAWKLYVRKEHQMQHNKQDKQEYQKPRLRIIELAAEEVLGTSCKTAPGAPGAANSVCGAAACALTTAGS